MDGYFARVVRTTRHTIDITPGARWRRAVRASIALAVFAVVFPLLWLLGGLVVLALVGGAIVMLAWATARQRWEGRRAASRVDTVDMR